MVSPVQSEHARVTSVAAVKLGTRRNPTAMVETLPNNNSCSQYDPVGNALAGKQVHTTGVLLSNGQESKKTDRRKTDQHRLLQNRPLLRARRSLKPVQEKCNHSSNWEFVSRWPSTGEITELNTPVDPASSPMSSIPSSSERKLDKLLIGTANQKEKRKSIYDSQSERQTVRESQMSQIHESSAGQSAKQCHNPYDTHSRRRPSHRHSTPQDSFSLRSDLRAEQRRERSRLAAQIRRNRESQSLMLLQNALPISTDVLGLHGVLADASGLLSLFSATVTDEDEPDKPDLEEDLLLLTASDLTLESADNEPCKLLLASSPPPPPPSVVAGSTSAINLEKSDIIRIAGHTMFMLNHVHPYLGLTPTPTLTLHSHSLYGLLIDTTDMRIVYVTPALAERIGWTWINLIGTPLRNVIQSNNKYPVPFSFNFCSSPSAIVDPKSSSRQISETANVYQPDQECDSSSGIGTGSTDATPQTMSSCSPSPISTPPIPVPKISSSSTNRLLQFLCINRPTRLDSASSRLQLGSLSESGEPRRRRRSRKKSNIAKSRGLSRAPLDPLFLTLDDLGPVADCPWYSEANSLSDASGSPLIFHCWYTGIQEQPASRLSTDRWLDHNSVSQPSSPINSGQGLDDVDEHLVGSADMSAAQHVEEQNQNSSTGGQPILHELQLCLLQPLALPDRSTKETAINREGLSDHPPNRSKPSGSRKPRSNRRRGPGRVKQAECDHEDNKDGTASNPDTAMIDPLTASEQLDSSNGDLLNQLSHFDLSSLSPNPEEMDTRKCTCFSPIYCCSGHCCSFLMRLGNYGQIVDVQGVPDTSLDSTAQSDLIGRSFLSLIHLDDMELVIDTVNTVTQNCSIGWTPIYRMCTSTHHAEIPSTRKYQWIRSLIQFVDDASATLICWHQPVGCAPTISPWNKLTHETLSTAVVPEFRCHGSLSAAGSGLFTNSSRNSLSPMKDSNTAKSKPTENAVTQKTKNLDISASSLDPLPLPSSIKALRIVQMPEQKRWTIEIQSPSVPIQSAVIVSGSAVRKPVKATSVSSVTRGGTNAQSHRTRPEGTRRRRKAPQSLRTAQHPTTVGPSLLTQTNQIHNNQPLPHKIGGAGGVQTFRFPSLSQLQQWYGGVDYHNALSPMYSSEEKQKSKRKLPILIRRSPCESTAVGTPTGQSDLWPSPDAENPTSELSHGSSTSTCPSPGMGNFNNVMSPFGYPWLTPVNLPFVSTPLNSPTVDELAEAELDCPTEDHSPRRELFVDDGLLQYDQLNAVPNDHELFVVTGEAGAYVEV